MAKVSAFTALRYDTKKVDIKKVVAPPYDVINYEQRKGYIRKSPYNIVQIDLPEDSRGERDYKVAKKLLSDWTAKGILKEDMSPSIYIYCQECMAGSGKIKRYGVFSLLKLPEGDKKVVLPHEKIFTKPFMDRVRLMKETRTHLSPIFFVFRDKDGAGEKTILDAIKNKKPDYKIDFEGTRNTLWRICDEDIVERLSAIIGSSKIFIADGHHRFQASCKVRDYFKNPLPEGAGYTLSYFVSSKDKGLKILPTHRAVKVLPQGFSIEKMVTVLSPYFDAKEMGSSGAAKAMALAAKRQACAFAVFYKNRYFLLTLKDKNVIKGLAPKEASYDWKKLDVSILHNFLFPKLGIKETMKSRRNIYYYKATNELVKRVRSGEQVLGVFMNAPRMEEVEKIAENDEKMPHKSTYFYPKPLTGLLIHGF